MTHVSAVLRGERKQTMQTNDVGETFAAAIASIAADHDPAGHIFFRRLKMLPPSVATNPDVLGQIHLIYQAAMHATRAAVYLMPHLDSPALRKRKLTIFIDDDGLPGGDTHHYQLTRAFRTIGAQCVLEDEEFAGAEELARRLDPDTARFVRLAAKLYARSLGPWCVVETMSDSWMHALADALSTHFPEIVNEPYFAECFGHGVEERHAAEALEVTGMVLRRRPELYSETVADARQMAEALDGVWNRLNRILTTAELADRSSRAA